MERKRTLKEEFDQLYFNSVKKQESTLLNSNAISKIEQDQRQNMNLNSENGNSSKVNIWKRRREQIDDTISPSKKEKKEHLRDVIDGLHFTLGFPGDRRFKVEQLKSPMYLGRNLRATKANEKLGDCVAPGIMQDRETRDKRGGTERIYEYTRKALESHNNRNESKSTCTEVENQAPESHNKKIYKSTSEPLNEHKVLKSQYHRDKSEIPCGQGIREGNHCSKGKSESTIISTGDASESKQIHGRTESEPLPLDQKYSPEAQNDKLNTCTLMADATQRKTSTGTFHVETSKTDGLNKHPGMLGVLPLRGEDMDECVNAKMADFVPFFSSKGTKGAGHCGGSWESIVEEN